MISTAQFAVEDTAAMRGLNQLKEALDSMGATTNQEGQDGYSGYVLVAIPLKNGTWCPGSGVVTGFISQPSLELKGAEGVGERI